MKFVVVEWCVHPDFMPHEKLIAVPEPELSFFLESPLCLWEHEVIHSELKVLRYLEVPVRFAENTSGQILKSIVD